MTRRRLGVGLALLGVIAIARATLVPVGGRPDGGYGLCLICGQLGGVDAILNGLLFVPLGIGLALAGVRPWIAITAMCLSTFAIEMLQFQAIPGRDASLGDLMTNSLGGLTGFLVGRSLDVFIRPGRTLARGLTIVCVGAWIALQVVIGRGFRTDLAEPPYYGQTGVSLEENPQFPGRLLSARAAGREMPLGGPAIPGSQDLRDALMKDLRVTATIVPGKSIPDYTTIFQLADDTGAEILSLAAERTSLLFLVRTHAASWRLRPLGFQFRDALRYDPARPDTIAVEARMLADGAEMSVTSRGETRRISIPLTTGAGWTLVAPFRLYVDGSTRHSLPNVAWLFGLMVPVGYWAASAGRGGGANRAWSVAVAVVSISALWLGPASGLAGPAVSDVVGVVLGLAGGAAVARWTARREPAHTPPAHAS